MCMSDLMSGEDLYYLTPGLKFCIKTNDQTYEATKIVGYNSYCVVDIPELGEEGEGIEIFYEEINEDGTIHININDETFPNACQLRRHKDGNQ